MKRLTSTDWMYVIIVLSLAGLALLICLGEPYTL